MPRLPSTISLMRRGGTPIEFASLVWLISIGRRNSSRSISPGCMFCNLPISFSLAVVDYLDHIRAVARPHKTDAPLIVDADAVLPFSIIFQCFEPIGRRHLRII